jgi:hypothetical protein
MVRIFNEAWLIHHHAASTSRSRKAGVAVLNHIGRFINESNRIQVLRLRYVLCYFRPENRFPQRVFGGAAEAIGDNDRCMVENFAYFHLPREVFSGRITRLAGWRLSPSHALDLVELHHYCSTRGSALMLKALELEPDSEPIHGLAEEYRKIGLRRQKNVLSLKKDGELRAVILVSLTDLGLNLSDLTNNIQIFVTDPENLPPEVLRIALRKIMKGIRQSHISCLLYPSSYAASHGINFEKHYSLWVLDLRAGDSYLQHLEGLIRCVLHRSDRKSTGSDRSVG